MADDTIKGAGTARTSTTGTTTTGTTTTGTTRRYDADDVAVRRAEAAALAQPGLLKRVSWGAIFAGTAIAFGIQFLLGLLGIAIGASVFNPADPAGFSDWGIGTGLYIVITQIISLIAGGFVAARLAGIPKNTTSLIHGAVVWAVVSFLSAYMVLSGVGALIGGATGALGQLASGTGNAVEAVLPDDLSALPTPGIEDLPQGVRQALRENDITAEDLRQEVRGIYRDTISRGEQRRLSSIARRTLGDIADDPADATAEIEDAIDRVVGQGGVISDQELAQLQDSLQERLGLSNREVQQLTSEIERAAQEARANLAAAVETAQTEAAEAADAAASAASGAARTAFFASLLGLIAAALGGLAGEPKHSLVRDDVDVA